MKLSEFIPQTSVTEARVGQTDLKLPALDHTMREFDSSEDFESMFSDISQAVAYAKAALESEAFKDWMESSANNFDFSISRYEDVLKHVTESVRTLNRLYAELEDAST